jgi:DNA-binding transcriptional MerR regulator
VRLYRARGLLPPPELRGRTGWYGEGHLRRLRLIARLQSQGHSLAGIGELLARWGRGQGLDEVLDLEAEVDALLGGGVSPVVLSAADLFERFPAGSLDAAAMARAGELGLVSVEPDGAVRVADPRFLDTGATLANLGLPVAVILDQWAALRRHTDDIARRFVDVFEAHLAPSEAGEPLDDDATRDLAVVLAQLRTAAREVLLAAFDASLARVGEERLGQVFDR